MRMRVHLDSDFAGDPDDACALAMLLGWPSVELAGITTALEHLGRRAGCVRHVLDLVGRLDVPLAAGAETTLTGRHFEPTWGDSRHWPNPVEPRPGPAEVALDLLTASIASGATVIAIGGFTNLALLELSRPGSLDGVPVVAMSGWFRPAADGLPQWGAEIDFNTQADTRAAEIVAAAASLTLVPLPIAIGTWLRRHELGRLRAAGELGRLLAAQSEAHALDAGFAELARAHRGLPDDLVNFHWDPVTCAVALGWSGARVEDRRLTTRIDEGVLTFVDDPDGRQHRCVTSVDGEAFGELWLTTIERIATTTV
jgi:inosine-uridine nucleoside N-ribohydrolase